MIPLTVRSSYSLMWGVNAVQDICRTARQMGYSRLALTDTDNLYGLWPFLSACRQEGLTPIVGAEVTDTKSKARAVCLVENQEGYRNLCRLLTRRHMDDTFCLKKALVKFAAGLIVLVGDTGLLAGCHEAAVRVAAVMPRHPLAPGHKLRRTAIKLNVPVVATPGSFFLRPEDYRIHLFLRAIGKNTSLSCLSSLDTAPRDAWLASAHWYKKRFDICPEAIRGTYALSERLSFTGPDFGIVLPPLSAGDSRTADGILRRAAYEGAHKRYGYELSEIVVERLEHELKIIADMGFSTYFLMVRDIVKESPRTCGRGSGAASLVAYCLAITNVCPIKHNLYFERFLNPGRKDPPDIDVDFAWDERDDVIGSVLEQNRGNVAMVCNHVTFKPRMAIREIAKVFGLTDAEIGQVSKRLPFRFKSDSEEELFERLKKLPRLKHLDFPPPWPDIIRIAQKIVGIPRYLSVHPGGVVITPRPIDEYVPVQKAVKGVPIIQWEKDAAEEAGLVKIDLLGNRSLGVIRDAIANIRENGIAFEESGWEPEDDYITQEALSQGKTMGCFYIESPAMRLLQQKSGVGDFEHLVIHSSIIRPAANDFIQEYIRRLHGGSWAPIHPLLGDVLNETFGLMVYQEDVSRVAVSLAGFSHVEADGLRRVMSKKDKEHQLVDFFERFSTGASERGVSDEQIRDIWGMMMSFNGYSFCKPHSASYARVSFQAAFLKVYYPAEFMAAVISNQGGFYSTFAYVSEARRLGLTILSPDVNRSKVLWTGRDNTMRVGLLSIKQLSVKTREQIISERSRSPFQNLEDFLNRVHPDEPEARALIRCGALDAFHSDKNRSTLMWNLAAWHASRQKAGGKMSLFSEQDSNNIPSPFLPAENEKDRLRREFSILGFLCGCHPMTLYQDVLKTSGTIKAATLSMFVNKRVRFAGWLITGKTVHTKNGDPMEFLTFEDETGIVETTFFPTAYKRFCHIIDGCRPYILSGIVDQNWGAVTLTVEKVEPVHI